MMLLHVDVREASFIVMSEPSSRAHRSATRELAAQHYRGSRVAREAGAQAAYVAIVGVEVTPGDEQAFLEASLENARRSVREKDNQRFDLLQSVDEQNKFALVEIYRTAEGPIDHKSTEHYSAWRDTVADMMASPRVATQWDTLYPQFASGYAPVAIILERPIPAYFDVTHVFIDVAAGSEDAFIAVTLSNAQQSMREPEAMRFDFLRSVDDPTKFLLIEVYRSEQGAADHKETEHYLTWRETVAGMMATPRVGKKYKNHFPNLPAGWQANGDMMQNGGKNWAR